MSNPLKACPDCVAGMVDDIQCAYCEGSGFVPANVMPDEHLDRRLAELATDAQKLCAALEATELTLDRAVILGALTSCAAILNSLCGSERATTQLVLLDLIEPEPEPT